MPHHPGHQAITASAGSGKTFQLAHRYLRLLAGGASPEEIVALTFSRKAAGEIFDSIVTYLCDAAACTEAASALGERLDLPDLTPGDCTAMLRRVLDSLHRLRVETLDSFTTQILRRFPLELGIPPGFTLMESEGAAATAVQQRIMDGIFRKGTGDRRAQRDFLSAFQQANLGRRNKQVEDSLTSFITQYQAHIRAVPDSRLWGHRDVIWPDGTSWLDAPSDPHVAESELTRLCNEMGLPDDAARRLQAFVTAAARYTVNSPWTQEISYLFDKLRPCINDLRGGNAVVKMNRTACDLGGEMAQHVLTLIHNLVRTEIESAMRRTRGIYQMLAMYEHEYDEVMRRSGTISFIDAQYLLTRGNRTGNGTVLSSTSGQDYRLYIDYRLDAHLNHWLLDEFQDTSNLQWEVLSNLIDEVLQDSGGRRSFFYVGDVKQAIYGWRGGNPRLFSVPLNRYPGQIDLVPLTRSYRSSQPVIDIVNDVFDDLAASSIPGRTVGLWNGFWQRHECAHGHVPQKGFGALIEPPCDGGQSTPENEDRYRVVARLLQEIEPIRRGLSTAILVRSNPQGKALVNYLRQELPDSIIIHEGRAAIKDNPVVALLLSLIACSAHPGDLLAWRHVQMSPLNGVLHDMKLNRDSLPPHVLRQIQTEGFQGTLREWARHLDRTHKLDTFGRIRLEQLLSAAGEYDDTGSASCNGFLEHIDQYEFHETGASDAIRVMTIHQSKGLGFDLVILPELDKHNMLRTRDLSLLISRDTTTQEPRWALEIPRRAVAECDTTLRAEIENADADTTFESLCLLYVAMTRAKRGLYIVTSFPGRTSAVFNQPALIKERLVGTTKPTEEHGRPVQIGGEWFTCLYPPAGKGGDERWFEEFALRSYAPSDCHKAETATELSRRPSQRTSLTAMRPSDTETFEESAAALFHQDRKQRLEAGIAVHELLRQIRWEDEMNVEATAMEWSTVTSIEADTRDYALDRFRRALRMPQVREALRRPGGEAVLWRERRFDVVLDNRWITGSFDRVVITTDAYETPQSATIYDFKTDEISAAQVPTHADLYRSQMDLYRAALSRILSLPVSRIRTVLVFTSPGVSHDLDSGSTSPRK